MKFLINFATRSRPDNFFRAIKSIEDNWSGEHQYKIVVTLDADDETMVNDDVLKRLRDIKHLTYYVGASKNKIDAINRSIPHFAYNPWHVLINMSDDMIFNQKGFDNTIAQDVEATGGLDCYMHYRDINHKKKDALCTLHIVGKEYFLRDNIIYHPAFESVYADNFNDHLAKHRKCYHFFDKVIFEHLHCAYGKSKRDAQYERTEDRKVYAKDKHTFQRLVKTGEGL